jgi:hypothetical protein
MLYCSTFYCSNAPPNFAKQNLVGAGGGNRTPTGLPLLDFESSARKFKPSSKVPLGIGILRNGQSSEEAGWDDTNLAVQSFYTLRTFPLPREVKIPAAQIPDRIVKAIRMPLMKGSTGTCAPDLADKTTLPSWAERTDVAIARLIA